MATDTTSSVSTNYSLTETDIKDPNLWRLNQILSSINGRLLRARTSVDIITQISGGGGGGGGVIVSYPSFGITPITSAAGILIPNIFLTYTDQTTLFEAVTVASPIGARPGQMFCLQIFQPATGAGFAAGFSSFYAGVTQFVVDVTPGTYTSVLFQVQTDLLSAVFVAGATGILL